MVVFVSHFVNFDRHVSHIGWNAQGGFEAKNLPPEWAKFFESLDQAMKKMGGKGLTKQEALYVHNSTLSLVSVQISLI